MNKEDITNKFENIEITKVQKVGGEFKNDAGQEIKWHGYKVELQVGDYKVKAKIDKVYNEIMDDLIEEKNMQ